MHAAMIPLGQERRDFYSANLTGRQEIIIYIWVSPTQHLINTTETLNAYACFLSGNLEEEALEEGGEQDWSSAAHLLSWASWPST